MEQYISKSALVAEIEKCYNECLKRAKITDSDYWNAKADAYRNVLEILNDTLEVKEVDLEKEFEWFLDEVEGVPRMWHSDEQIQWAKDIAKHFFELGIKAQKGEL